MIDCLSSNPAARTRYCDGGGGAAAAADDVTIDDTFASLGTTTPSIDCANAVAIATPL